MCKNITIYCTHNLVLQKNKKELNYYNHKCFKLLLRFVDDLISTFVSCFHNAESNILKYK